MGIWQLRSHSTHVDLIDFGQTWAISPRTDEHPFGHSFQPSTERGEPHLRAPVPSCTDALWNGLLV